MMMMILTATPHYQPLPLIRYPCRFEGREAMYVKQAENYASSQWDRYAQIEYTRLASEGESRATTRPSMILVLCSVHHELALLPL